MGWGVEFVCQNGIGTGVGLHLGLCWVGGGRVCGVGVFFQLSELVACLGFHKRETKGGRWEGPSLVTHATM